MLFFFGTATHFDGGFAHSQDIEAVACLDNLIGGGRFIVIVLLFVGISVCHFYEYIVWESVSLQSGHL